MSEGYVAALLKPAETDLYETVEQFMTAMTDGLKTDRCSKTIVELSGPVFDSRLEDRIDEFVARIGDASFARLLFHDEYGTEIFWVIDDGEISKFRHDQEEVSKRVVQAYEALHAGMGSVRKGSLSKADVAAMKKETRDARTQQYLDVLFVPPVAMSLDALHFDDGYYQALGASADEESSYAHWFPISGNNSKPPEGLIQQLIEKTNRSFYAKAYRDGSRTERILHCSAEGITELFNTDDYTDDELEYVQAHTEETYGKVNWKCFPLGAIRAFLDTTTLRDYVEEKIAARRAEIAEDRRKLKAFMAAHPNERESILEGIGFYLWYVEEDEELINELAWTLQIKGMKKEEVEKLFRVGKANRVRVSSKLKAAGEWLVENVEALRDHEVVVEAGDSDFVFIHMH